MPAGNVVPHGDHLAFVSLFWPGIPLAQESIGATNDSQCSQPLLTPTAVRFDFKGIAPITVSQLNNTISSLPLALCGSSFNVEAIGPLSN
jgi:hypothetical protein